MRNRASWLADVFLAAADPSVLMEDGWHPREGPRSDPRIRRTTWAVAEPVGEILGLSGQQAPLQTFSGDPSVSAHLLSRLIAAVTAQNRWLSATFPESFGKAVGVEEDAEVGGLGVWKLLAVNGSVALYHQQRQSFVICAAANEARRFSFCRPIEYLAIPDTPTRLIIRGARARQERIDLFAAEFLLPSQALREGGSDRALFDQEVDEFTVRLERSLSSLERLFATVALQVSSSLKTYDSERSEGEK